MTVIDLSVPQTVRISEVARALDISTNTIYRQIREGTFPLPVIRNTTGKGAIRVSRIHLERLLAGSDPHEVSFS